jgi:hypothetical protein
MPVSILASEIESRRGTSEGKQRRERRHRPNITNNVLALMWRSLNRQGRWPAFQRRHLSDSHLNHACVQLTLCIRMSM